MLIALSLTTAHFLITNILDRVLEFRSQENAPLSTYESDAAFGTIIGIAGLNIPPDSGEELAR